MRRAARSGEAGFTLIEMLVGLAVVALVGVVLLAGLGRITVGSAMARRGEARVEDVAAAQLMLRQLLENAQPVRDAQTGNTIDFAGSTDRMDFLAEPPESAGPGVLQRYRLKVDGRGALMLYRLGSLDGTVDPRQPGTVGWTPTQLIGGVSAMALRFYGPPSDGAGRSWWPDWVHQSALPLIVRVRIEFPQGDARAWPDLVVRLRAANGDVCERDLRTNACRGAT